MTTATLSQEQKCFKIYFKREDAKKLSFDFKLTRVLDVGPRMADTVVVVSFDVKEADELYKQFIKLGIAIEKDW